MVRDIDIIRTKAAAETIAEYAGIIIDQTKEIIRLRKVEDENVKLKQQIDALIAKKEAPHADSNAGNDQ